MEAKLPTRKSTGRRNLIFFGDSISFGELVNPHRNWVTKLSIMIEEQYGTDYLVINCSINGTTSRQALERMPFDVQRYGVDLLCIQFGMNDCNYWQTDEGLPRVSPGAYRSNLKEMVSRALHFGAQKILLPTSHPVPHVEPYGFKNLSYETSRRDYSAIVREVTEETGAFWLTLKRGLIWPSLRKWC